MTLARLTLSAAFLSALAAPASLGQTSTIDPQSAVEQLSQSRICVACDLRDADLRGFDLVGADLTGADLRGANLATADLTDAILVGADLRGASLVDSMLGGADLHGAQLENADFSGANLDEASVSPDELEKAIICYIWLPNRQLFFVHQNCP